MRLSAIPFLLCFIILFFSSSCIHYIPLLYAAAVVVGGGEQGEEEEEEKLAYSKIDLSDNPANTYDYFIKQLGNLEFTINLDANQIFPNDEIKQDIVNRYRPAEYNIANLEHELLGFKIIASDIEIHVDPTKIDTTETRIDIPTMLAKNVKVSNGLINLAFKQIDLGSIYAIYDRNLEKMTVHIPISTAYKYLQQ